MKKIYSLILALLMLFTAIPAGFTALAADDNVYCYIANKSSLDTVYNNMQYTSDDYATVNDALDAAFEAFANAPISGSGTYRICLAKDIVLTEPLAPQPSVKKGSHFHLNGHSITYNPTSEYADTSAITISSTYFSNISVYGVATEDGPDTLINKGTAYFFSTTLSGSNGQEFKVYGSYKGEFTATKMRTYMEKEKATFYGNVTSNDFSASTNTYIKGDLYVGAFWSGTGVEVTVTGDYTCNGRTYPTATLNVGGNFYGNMTSGNRDTFKVNTTSNITVGGDAVLNSKTGGNLFDPSFNTPGKIVFGGTVTLTGAPTSIVFKNTTFKKGIINNTTNNAKIVLDTSDIIGSVFNVDNELYQISETTYGSTITPPSDPIKDGYTFIGWENADGVLVDFTNEIQGEYSVYNARFTPLINEPSPVTMKAGASIRLNDVNGIRFYTTVDAEKLAELKNVEGNVVEFGTLIAPADKVTGELTHSIGADNYVDVPYKNEAYFEDTTFVGSIVNIKPANYGRAFIGRGYIKVTNGDDVTYYYAKLDDNARSIKVIASAYKADVNSGYSELDSKTKELVDNWASAADWSAQ